MRDGNGEIVETAMAFLDLTDSACTIIDNWHVAGMAGSGSHMIVANDLFVPDAPIQRPSQNPPREALLVREGLEPRHSWPMEPVFPLGVLAPMLGAASAILEGVLQSADNRPVTRWSK